MISPEWGGVRTININPGTLMNRGRLFTTQTYIDLTKLMRAIEGQPDLEEEPPSGWTYIDERGHECYVFGDGNHRTALAIIRGGSIPFTIVGQWDPRKKKVGFNFIVNRVKSELKGGGYL